MIKWRGYKLKVRVSATIDKVSLKMIDNILIKGRYRNRSHIIEEAIKFFNKRVEEEDEK